jgi:UDPglucose--hexose-1-phosphate uridylyltransferase
MRLPEHSHRRQNLLTGEWVLVSPQRTQRPWQGQVEPVQRPADVEYDAQCYLCPGNRRAAGRENPLYEGPYAFDNDFPALSPAADLATAGTELLKVAGEHGHCRVVCFSHRHDRHLADMSVEEITGVLGFLAEECRQLDSLDDCQYVQAFENRGAMMGCSNPHPHAQVWATGSLPNEPAKELRAQREYYEARGRSLLIDYLDNELRDGTRVLASNDHAVSLVPFWANWPFETLLMPREPAGALHDLSHDRLAGFAAVLRTTLLACDRLFDTPMPYSMGYHPRPGDGLEHPEWHFHAHIYPPLLRSATIRKHMVGFEMLGMSQRDLTAEVAAERLRAALEKESA